MRPDAPTPDDLAAGLVFSTRADIIVPGGARVLGVPVSAGRVVTKGDSAVPDGVEGLVLPDRFEGHVLRPRRRGSMLGADGHELALTTTVWTLSRRRRWVIPMGRYLVTSVEPSAGELRVTAAGMLQRVATHLRGVPGATATASPIAGEIMAILVADGLEVDFDPRLPGRSLPAGFGWGSDRLKSVVELVAAWPARIVMDGRGVVRILPPPAAGEPVITWADGQDGPRVDAQAWRPGLSRTVISAPEKVSREGVVNHVIVKVPGGQSEDGEQQPDRYVELPARTGRYSVEAFGWVSRLIEHDAITSVGQAQSVAVEELAKSGRRSWVVDVDAVPTWLPEIGDNVALLTEDGPLAGLVAGTDMPLTPADGAARYQVEVQQ